MVAHLLRSTALIHEGTSIYAWCSSLLSRQQHCKNECRLCNLSFRFSMLNASLQFYFLVGHVGCWCTVERRLCVYVVMQVSNCLNTLKPSNIKTFYCCIYLCLANWGSIHEMSVILKYVSRNRTNHICKRLNNIRSTSILSIYPFAFLF